MSSAQQMPDTCTTREQLAGSVQQSHREMARLGEREVQAIVGGDVTELAELEGKLRDARRKCDADLSAFRDHVAEHDCL